MYIKDQVATRSTHAPTWLIGWNTSATKPDDNCIWDSPTHVYRIPVFGFLAGQRVYFRQDLYTMTRRLYYFTHVFYILRPENRLLRPSRSDVCAGVTRRPPRNEISDDARRQRALDRVARAEEVEWTTHMTFCFSQ